MPRESGARRTSDRAARNVHATEACDVILLPALFLLLQASGADTASNSTRSAFKDADARDILLRARAARLVQDSAIIAYDAKSYQRVSIGGGPASVGRDRVMFAFETVGRVRWQLGRGAWIDLTGMRAHGVVGDATVPIPYYPGVEATWIDGGPLKETIDQFALVHPIAAGAEAHYTYASGDSMSIRLPDGTLVRLRELRVRPRRASSNLVVGSFWFDRASGQLVRAAYRPAASLDVWVKVGEPDSVTGKKTSRRAIALEKAIVSPVAMEVSAISVEYSLHEGRFWLPRGRVLSGSARASFLRGSMLLEQRFDYSSVNVRDTLPGFVAQTVRIDTDTLKGREKVLAVAGLRGDTTECLHASRYVVTRVRDGVPLAMTVPCNLSTLSKSSDLPPSIFAVGEDERLAADRNALIASALSLGAQSPFGPSAPTIGFGLGWMRFNRVEGFSIGAQMEQPIGAGYSAQLLGRFGFSDRMPNVDLRLTRSNLTDSIHLAGYARLVSANDWGNPLSLSSSLSAALFGRDEGFYYRSYGVEIGGGRAAEFGRGAHVEWRVFSEREGPTRSRLRTALDGASFVPNIEADEVTLTGAALRLTRSYGLDPRGLRLLTDARLEVAGGRSSYGRAALDMTASKPLGSFIGAMTLSSGESVGTLPAQRRWFLGGSQTIRGQSPDTTTSGGAYWFSRMELALPGPLAPSLFYDFGRDRSLFHSDDGHRLSGAGLGIRFLDGLMRFDVARGISPRKQWRLDLSLDARF